MEASPEDPKLPLELISHILSFIDNPKILLRFRVLSSEIRSLVDNVLFRHITRIHLKASLRRVIPANQGQEFGSYLELSGPRTPKIRMNPRSNQFSEALRQCWKRSSQYRELSIESYERMTPMDAFFNQDLGYMVLGDGSPFFQALDLIHELNEALPQHFSTFEYLPYIRQMRIHPAALVSAWKPSLRTLHILDGGGLLTEWVELLEENHISHLTIGLGPVATSPHFLCPAGGLIDFRVVQAILSQSDQPLTGLDLQFCSGSHHALPVNFLELASLFDNLAPVPKFHFEFPRTPTTLTVDLDRLRMKGIVNRFARQDPRDGFQLGLTTLSLGENAGRLSFSLKLWSAFPNLHTIKGLQCDGKLGRKIPSLVERFESRSEVLSLRIVCQPIAANAFAYRDFLIQVVTEMCNRSLELYWVDLRTYCQTSSDTVVKITEHPDNDLTSCRIIIVIPILPCSDDRD
jgi:hypothetical protein